VFAYHDAAAALLVNERCGSTVALGDEQTFIDRVAHLPKQQQLEQMRLESRQQVANLSWQVPAQDMIQMFYQVLVPATITREDRVKYASTKINHAIVSPQC
jgi:hypothetical protein